MQAKCTYPLYLLSGHNFSECNTAKSTSSNSHPSRTIYMPNRSHPFYSGKRPEPQLAHAAQYPPLQCHFGFVETGPRLLPGHQRPVTKQATNLKSVTTHTTACCHPCPPHRSHPFYSGKDQGPNLRTQHNILRPYATFFGQNSTSATARA